jgi:hypothetical protein
LAAIALGDIDIHCSLSSLCRERKPGASTLSQRPGLSGSSVLLAGVALEQIHWIYRWDRESADG